MSNSCLDCKYLEIVASEKDHKEPEPYCNKYNNFYNYYITLNKWFLESPKYCNSFLNKENILEDILYSLSVEENLTKETLSKYLINYPQYSNQILDLFYELIKETIESDISPEDKKLIDESWEKYFLNNVLKDATEAIKNRDKNDHSYLEKLGKEITKEND
jgi:hypothetical protein